MMSGAYHRVPRRICDFPIRHVYWVLLITRVFDRGDLWVPGRLRRSPISLISKVSLSPSLPISNSHTHSVGNTPTNTFGKQHNNPNWVLPIFLSNQAHITYTCEVHPSSTLNISLDSSISSPTPLDLNFGSFVVALLFMSGYSWT